MVRVGRIYTDDGPQFVVNPTISQMDYSDLDLVLAGHCDGVNMIEVGAAEIAEKDMVDAIQFGHDQIKLQLDLISELVGKVGKEKRVDSLALPTQQIADQVRSLVEADLTEARKVPGKADRDERVGNIREHDGCTFQAQDGRLHHGIRAEQEGCIDGEGGVPSPREEAHTQAHS